MMRLSKITGAFLVLVAGLSACTLPPSEAEKAAFLANLTSAEHEALRTAQTQPAGTTVADLMIAVLFAAQCDGVEINQDFGHMVEDRLKSFKKNATDADIAQVQATIVAFADDYGVEPVDLQDPAIACPAARKEIAKVSVTGAVLSEVAAQ